MNKLDLIPVAELEKRRAACQALLPDVPLIAFSATSRLGLDALLSALRELLPVRPSEYPQDQLTDLYEREIAVELIREAALVFLRDEVPHALAVRLDEFKERGSQGAFISVTLFVERESQKGILIGENGGMLKRIGSAARREIEELTGRKVYLDLRVKVLKNWRNDEAALRRFGYRIKE